MKRSIKCVIASCSVLAFAATGIADPITYVDMTDGAAGNTTGGTNSINDVFTPLPAQGPGGDGLWDVRAFANNATIYQNASSGNTDDAHRLRTTVTVADDTYEDVFVYFWSDTSAWRVQASLTDDQPDMPLYTPTSSGVRQFWTGADATVFSDSLAVNPFTTAVMIAEGNRRLYQARLGSITGTEIAVFIDDSSAQASSNERTWVDGIGYRIPEPSSMVMYAMGLGILGMASRRNRR